MKRRLGKTEFEITTIGLGTWAIGGRQWGRQDDEASIEAIHAAVDHGVNWVDTAPIYGSGHSEEVVGRAVKALPASRRPLVFTKFGLGVNVDAPMKSATARAKSSRSARRACAASASIASISTSCTGRRRSRSPRRPARARSCWRRARFARSACRTSRSRSSRNGWRPACRCTRMQPPYSILRPAAAEDVLPWCAAHGVGAISYSPLFRGLLFGTWSRDKTFGAGRRARPAQGLLGRAISAAPRRGRRASGDRAQWRSELRPALRRRAAGDARPHRRDLRRARCPSGRARGEPRRDDHRRPIAPGVGRRRPAAQGSRDALVFIRGASPLGLPSRRSRSPLRRLAPITWLARHARSHLSQHQLYETASSVCRDKALSLYRGG